MAASAELSMKQAAALTQQQQIKEKELQVREGPGPRQKQRFHNTVTLKSSLLFANSSLSLPPSFSIVFPHLSLSTDHDRRE